MDYFTTLLGKIAIFIKKQKKMSAIILGVTILILLGFFIVVPSVQANIREKQINALVKEEFQTKKATFLTPKQGEEQIEKRSAITVMFAVPSGEVYEDILKILNDKTQMLNFNHSINIYPMLYDVDAIEKKYTIKRTTVTIVFFENGKEKNRWEIDPKEDLNESFIFRLNQLPMASATTPEPVNKQPQTQSTTPQSEAQQNQDQETPQQTEPEAQQPDTQQPQNQEVVQPAQ